MHWLLLIFIVLSSLMVMRMLITTVHEFGHAIAAYIFTKKKVILFLGSYGDEGRSIKVPIGSFELWIFKNILLWKGGLCRHGSGLSFRQHFLYVLAGPLASLLLFIVALVVFIIRMPQGFEGGLLLIFCIWTGLSFLHNIVPRNAPIDMQGGEINYNDGTHLKLLLNNRKMPPEFDSAVKQFHAGAYADCIAVFDAVIEAGTRNAEVYRMAIAAHIHLKNYRAAEAVQNELVARIGNINAHDRINMALLKTHLGKYDEAINYYQHLLQTGSGNKYNLNNFGYTLTLVNRYQDAIVYLDNAIAIDKDFASAYCNRAFAKMMLGWLKDGNTDNELALQLDDKNSYALRNRGIYLFETGKYADALVELNRSNELEPGIPLLNDYIWRAQQQVEA